MEGFGFIEGYFFFTVLNRAQAWAQGNGTLRAGLLTQSALHALVRQGQQRRGAVDAAVAQRAARLHVPDRRGERDALIAATALVHGMAVVTRNVADFTRPGLKVFDPSLGVEK